MSQIGTTVPLNVYDSPYRLSGVVIGQIMPGQLVDSAGTYTNQDGNWTIVRWGIGSDMMGNPTMQSGYVLQQEAQDAGGTIVPISTVGDTSTSLADLWRSGAQQIQQGVASSLGLSPSMLNLALVAAVALGAYLLLRPQRIVVER